MNNLFIVFLTAIPNSSADKLKYALMVCVVAYAIWLVVSGKKRVNFDPVFLGSMVVLLVFGSVGILKDNDPENVFFEISFLFTFAVILKLLIWNHRNSSRFYNLVCFGFSVYLFLKIGLYIFLSFGLISSIEIFHLIKDYAPGAVVSSLLGPIPRIIFTNDFLLPVFMAWLVCMRHFQNISGVIFVPLFWLSAVVVALSFSRYLYVSVFVVFFMAFYLRAGISTAVKYSCAMVLFVVSAAGAVSFLGYEDLISSRIVGSGGRGSTSLKFEQSVVLESFYSSPLLGGGFGLDLRLPGRNLNYPFQAEVQWIGYLAKFGMLGTIATLAIIFHCVRGFLSGNNRNNRVSLIITIMFLFWLLSGFTNPVLFLFTTTVNYLLLYSVHQENKKRA